MRVVLDGECTVARAPEIRQTLLAALDSGEPLELDLQGVTRIDMAFCQTMHALRASCLARGVALELLPDWPPEVAAVAERCGLTGLDKAGAP
jgi:anti-anti-sigma regulatory factor